MPLSPTFGQSVTAQSGVRRDKVCQSTDSLPADPLPASANGQRLCEIFGSYLYCTIYADTPKDTTEKPKWHTQRRYRLKNRVLYRDWQDSQKLVGVRPGQYINYALLDIDINSPYHPKQDTNAIARIEAALETIGITRTLKIRSSWSEGIHLYLPLPERVKTFDLAVALKNCLEPQGFKFKQGHLECFPNVKAYGNLIKTEYLAHRLPLQPASGSCLLDEAFNPTSHHLENFLDQWDIAAAGQDIATLQQALPLARKNRLRRVRNRLNKIESWKQDLETLLAEGWSGHSQTNQLLKEFGCYGHVFLSLSGESLADYIYQQAIASPGYKKWCRHQREIKMRSRVWATAIEKYYWPIGSYGKAQRAVKDTPSFNDLRAKSAKTSIEAAVQQLRSAKELPYTATARAQAIRKAQASSGESSSSLETLYKDENKKLWHPEFDIENQAHQSVIAPTSKTSVDQQADSLLSPQRPKPSKNKELRTKSGVMKCKHSGEALASSKTKFNSYRGVRGEFSHFPQLPVMSSDSFASEDRIRDQKVHNQSYVLDSSASKQKLIPKVTSRTIHSTEVTSSSLATAIISSKKNALSQSVIDIITTTQSVVKRLNWSAEQVHALIAQKFQGRRRSQLSDEEALELLYHLQVKSLETGALETGAT
ncbi:hypothetical protein S7335_110 [Synechococcus sp. PCC 7335]|uniref:hypothetical protein n=1 Tax=Synechococcus sp. (strain ATCC 29403 / PCC 7335) TaxID=91464 RepID=UPI00017EC0A9|nr:hypothetical protein [Synechococcus sp. PCC 7335]EDX82932.1 hypothetical protein S7335_110 [Synechococcus sp. PCC 7335]